MVATPMEAENSLDVLRHSPPLFLEHLSERAQLRPQLLVEEAVRQKPDPYVIQIELPECNSLQQPHATGEGGSYERLKFCHSEYHNVAKQIQSPELPRVPS